ncbi:hypothetical protein RND81_04G016600 [Saponaria officinalis]|uniref:rRNA N-glycosylase n=1 Tax=Saponaria officinalis TaxID=3572 RepID=A0AAW1LHX8_SAPOF
MKPWIVVVITWVILQSSASAVTLSLNLKTVTKAEYSAFLAGIRTNVRDVRLIYGHTNIPVIGNNPLTDFIRIDFKIDTRIVSVGVRRSDLYVVAYLANNDRNQLWAYYFSDMINSAQLDTLFKEIKGSKNKREITEYQENYGSLESAAKESRRGIGLGIDILVEYIENVDQKARTVLNEAKFMLITIQMVSEATRFGYIEKLILDNNFPHMFYPEDNVLILENNWAVISKKIKSLTNGDFTSPFEMDYTYKGTTLTWTVNHVAELNMGILKYIRDAEQRWVKIVVIPVVIYQINLHRTPLI